MMRRLVFWITLGLVLSALIVSSTKADSHLGIESGDTFQFTYEFSGESKDAFLLPHTNIMISKIMLPLVVDYTIKDILTNPNGTMYVFFDIGSYKIKQNSSEFSSPLDLADSFKLSDNISYIEPPPVISLDFEKQFDLLYTQINIYDTENNDSKLLDFGSTYRNDNFEIYFIANYSSSLENIVFQESRLAYNMKTGILESYESTTIYEDDVLGGYVDQFQITNTSPYTITTTTSSEISSSSISNFAIIFLLIILATATYFVLKSKPLKKGSADVKRVDNLERKNQSTPNVVNQYERAPPITQKKINYKPNVVRRILCPTCNTMNMLDSIYCLECGTYIAN